MQNPTKWLLCAMVFASLPSRAEDASQGSASGASSNVLPMPPLKPVPVIAGAPVVVVATHEAPPGSPPALKTVSLDVRDMDIVEVLKVLSKQSGVNMIVGRNVSGRVTLFLNNVDFWEALSTVLETRDLAYVNEGGLVRVITAQDFDRIYGASFDQKTVVRTFTFNHIKAKSARDVLEQLKSRVGVLVVNEMTNTLIVRESPKQMARFEEMLKEMDVPAETRVFAMSYGSVEDVLPKLQSLVSPGFGNIQSDKRSNSLVVTDNPARLAEIASVIKAFDVKNKSVLIEAKMVQVVLSDEYQWGINWERAFRANKNGNAYSGGLVFNSNAQLVPFQANGGAPVTGNAVGSANLSGLTGNITALTGIQLAGAVNMLQSFGRTRILSSPRVAALNNQEAKIKVVTKEIFITNTVLNPGSATQLPVVSETPNEKEVGVTLSVTPTIGNDGFMTLKIKPEVSSVQSTVKTSNGSLIPIIRTSEAEASLVVKDGVTVVIGGLIDDSKINDDSGVPFLSRIPLIGLLFKSRTRTNKKTELVIFLTPHIINGDVSSTEVFEQLPEKDWPQDLPKPKRGFFKRLFGKKA